MDLLWWHWLVLGLVLSLIELATPGGFFIIFFGIGAFIVGILTGLGVLDSATLELLLFGAVSLLLLLFFRSRLRRWVQSTGAPDVDTLIGDIGTVERDIGPDEVGRVELRGAMWSARNATSAPLRAGARCRVLRVDGLMLHVGPEGAR
jgi:membrane protein implicated in regulation of membrane protease activity